MSCNKMYIHSLQGSCISAIIIWQVTSSLMNAEIVIHMSCISMYIHSVQGILRIKMKFLDTDVGIADVIGSQCVQHHIIFMTSIMWIYSSQLTVPENHIYMVIQDSSNVIMHIATWTFRVILQLALFSLIYANCYFTWHSAILCFVWSHGFFCSLFQVKQVDWCPKRAYLCLHFHVRLLFFLCMEYSSTAMDY